MIGKKKCFFTFLITGFISNFISLSIYGQEHSFLGPSNGIYGILGASIGYIIFNWKNFDKDSSNRFNYCLQVGIVSFFMLFLNFERNQ